MILTIVWSALESEDTSSKNCEARRVRVKHKGYEAMMQPWDSQAKNSIHK